MIYALFLSLIFTGLASGQVGRKTPAAPAISAKTAASADHLSSEKGRFSITLPKDTAEYEDLKPGPDTPNESGGRWVWSLPEGVITVDYSDDPDFVIRSKEDYAGMEEGIRIGVTASNGSLLTKKPYRIGKHRGYQVTFRDPEKGLGFMRMLVVGERKYSIFGLTRTDAAAHASVIAKALDTFQLIDQK